MVRTPTVNRSRKIAHQCRSVATGANHYTIPPPDLREQVSQDKVSGISNMGWTSGQGPLGASTRDTTRVWIFRPVTDSRCGDSITNHVLTCRQSGAQKHVPSLPPVAIHWHLDHNQRNSQGIPAAIDDQHVDAQESERPHTCQDRQSLQDQVEEQ